MHFGKTNSCYALTIGIALLLPLLGACAEATTGMTGTPGPLGQGGVSGLGASGASGGAGRANSASGTGGSGVTSQDRGGTGGMSGASGMIAGGSGGTGTAGGGTAGMTGGVGAAGSAGTPMTMPPLTGPAPMLPAIQGTCPELRDGSTIMIGGHGGVLIAAGEPNKGGPLLFYFHGTGGSAQEALRTLPADVRNDIISSGGIIASFNGRQSGGGEGDCSGTGAHNMADFKAADQIAACAVQNHGIDPRRIYATGCSAGGLQSGCMAQMRSSYLAAAAPNSGGVVRSQPWQDMHSPAIFTMHGGSSDVVIVTFSQTSRTLDMSAKSHGSFVVNCDHGGGHCRAPAALQSAAWRFMKDHPWGTTMSPWAAGIPDGIPEYCMVF